MDELISLRRQYCDSIKFMKDHDDIVRSLPQPSYTNFFQIMQDLVNMIKGELETLADMKKGKLSDEDLKYVNEEIEINEMKLTECLKRFKEGQEKVEIDKEIEEEKAEVKRLLVAKSEHGNILLEGDLKSVSKEYYPDILDMIDELHEGKEDNGQYNVQKQRKLSNNSKINGIGELKRHGIRLYYLPLSGDALIIGSHEKHDNNPKEIVRFLENRRKLVDSEYKLLKENDSEKEARVAEDKEILDGIIEGMKKQARGEKHG